MKRIKALPQQHAGRGPCAVILFRLGLVHRVLARIRRGESPAQAAIKVASTPHPDHRGILRRISERTLRRWVQTFLERGEDGLRPSVRERASGPVSLTKELAEFFAKEKCEDPRASVPELIRRARVEGLIRPGQRIWRSTVYRTLTRMGVSLARRRRAADRDCRAFEYPHRLDMVLCDGKHFRAGAKRLKRVALNFIDDATRKLLACIVGPSESTSLFLRGLHLVLARVGLLGGIYADKGPGFVSLATREVLRRLGIPLIEGETAYPQGHAKVERFNRTEYEDVLREFSGNPEVDPAYEALEARLEHYRSFVYNVRSHEGLRGECPDARFDRDEKPLVFKPKDWLEDRFAIFDKRLVSSHHLVKHGGQEYEVPLGLAGSWVVLERRILEDDRLMLHHEGRLIELRPPDKAANARSKRAKRSAEKSDTAQKERRRPPRTAAGRQFARDHACVLDEDGGFPDPNKTSARTSSATRSSSRRNDANDGKEA